MKSYLKIGGILGGFTAVIALAAYLTLRVIVSGEDVVVVPNLVGKDVVYTLELLTNLGLNTKVSSHEYSTEVPKNHVSFQQPGPGAEIKRDRDVRIVVSRGPQTVTVPDLIGMDIHEANIILEDNGLTEGAVSATYEISTRGDQVLAQVPAPGKVVERGTPVDLLSSLGNRPVELMMPALEGFSIQEAVSLLEHSRLSLGQMTYVEDVELPEEIIVGHTPAAGYPVTTGSLINLTVNRKERGPFVREKAFHLLTYPVAPGFLKRHIRFRVNAFGFVYDLVDVFADPGQRLQALLPGGKRTRFFLYEDDDLVWDDSFSSPPLPLSPVTVVEDNPSIIDHRLLEDPI